mmetsp:Transcript_61186/g.112117  ORF Transcript_61186/g.112117 Transcript_61186/m.112117 type:complete len:416 (+) Transcript_61186:94-1341(+)
MPAQPMAWWSPWVAVILTSVHGAPYVWQSHPIEVRNQSLYDSVTNKPWYGKGIGFPRLGDSPVKDYIAVLQRINKLSPTVNLIRLYQPPSCAIDSNCFEAFMQEADRLGIYVLVPGTGTSWGWLPNTVAGCHSPDGTPTANDCYKAGGVLGWGQRMVQQFNYPNTLAICIGNEYDQMSPMWRYFGVLKAYARDLKNYMQMCNTDAKSPTKGKMRMIPLAYANSDDGGDYRVKPKAEYLFCGSSGISVDIFGLNIERWCDDVGGRGAYNGVNSWVRDDKFPGAFMFTEMGCSKYIGYTGARDWAQVRGFFQSFPAVTSYIAYTYNGNSNFDMFDGPTATAKIFEDGTNFFKQVNSTGVEPAPDGMPPSTPVCATELLGTPLDSVDSIQWYDTGATGWAPQCPRPYQAAEQKGVLVV